MLVSVIIPAHNRPELFKRTLASYLDQSWDEKELVIVDDSADAARDAVMRTVAGLPGVQYHSVSPMNQPEAINYGIAQAKGEVVVMMHDDDVFYDERSLWRRIYPFLDGYMDAEVAWSASMHVGPDGRDIALMPAGNVNAAYGWDKEYISFPSMAWRKSIHSRIGWLDTSLIDFYDSDWKLRCLMECACVAVKEPTVRYRIHSGQRTVAAQAAGEWVRQDRIMRDKLNAKYGGIFR